jgi:hypothetical protein
MKKPALQGLTIVLTALFAISCIITPANGALTWTIQTVDSPGNVGIGSSIVLDNLGHPWISYGDATDNPNYHLKVAHFTGTTWQTSVVDTTGDKISAIALDNAGNPAIAYLDAINLLVEYAKIVGGVWQIETVDPHCETSTSISLVIDASNNPHITYIDGSDMEYPSLTYATCSGGTWSLEVVSDTCDMTETSPLQLDSAGNPCISYYDPVSGTLLYAKKVGSTWLKETVDSTGGNYPSLKLNSAGNPCISYFTMAGLQYAYLSGGIWHKETVDPTVALSCFTSLALDNSNYARIAYWDQVSNSLRYAYYDGTAWHVEIIDTGKVGKFNSLTLDNTGNPYISYLDEKNNDLKYAYSVILLPSVTPESGGALALVLSAMLAIGCYIGLKRRTLKVPCTAA